MNSLKTNNYFSDKKEVPDMVEDGKIEAKKSPFALREGEIKTFDGKDRICFYEPNCAKNKLRSHK